MPTHRRRMAWPRGNGSHVALLGRLLLLAWGVESARLLLGLILFVSLLALAARL